MITFNPKPTLVNARYVNPFTGQLRNELLRTGTNLPTVNYDEQLRLLGTTSPFLSEDETNNLFAKNQSTGERFGRSAGNFVRQFVAGAINSFGGTVDISSGLKAMGIVSSKIDNIFFRLGDEILSNEKKIYELDPNRNNPADPGWWFNMASTVGNVLGIAAESFLEAAVLGALIPETGGVSGVLEAASLAKKAGSLSKAIKVLTKSKQIRNFATNMAIFKRYGESVLEARQSQQDIEKRLISEGIDKTAALALASKEAAKTFWKNMPLVVLDIIGAQMMFVNPVSGATEGVLEKLISKVPTVAGRVGAKVLTEGISQGSEEFIQNVIQAESMYSAETATGLVDKIPFSKRMNDHLKNSDDWRAFWGGAIGGIALGGFGPVVRKFTDMKANKYYDNKYETFNSLLSGKKIELINQIKEDETNGKYESAQSKRRILNTMTGVHALHLDHTSNRDSTAFDSNKEMLSTLLTGIQSRDKDTLEELELTDDNQIKLVEQELTKYIEDLDAIKDTYNSLKDTVHKDSLETSTYYGFAKKLISKELGEANRKYENNLGVLTNQNTEVGAKLKNDIERDTINELIGIYENQVKDLRTKLDGIKRDKKDKDTDNSKSLKTEKFKTKNEIDQSISMLTYLKKRRTEFKEIENISEESNEVIKQLNTTDNDNIRTMMQHKADIISLEKAMDDVTTKFNTWISTDHQKKVILRAQENIKNNQKKIKEIKNTLEKIKQKDPKIEDIITKGAKDTAASSGADLDDSRIISTDNPKTSEQTDTELEDSVKELNENTTREGDSKKSFFLKKQKEREEEKAKIEKEKKEEIAKKEKEETDSKEKKIHPNQVKSNHITKHELKNTPDETNIELEEKVKEIKSNISKFKGVRNEDITDGKLNPDAKFIDLESGEEYDAYYNIETGEIYARVSTATSDKKNITIDDENKDNKNKNGQALLSSSQLIGNKVDRLTRDILAEDTTSPSTINPKDYNIANPEIVDEYIEQVRTFKAQLEANGETILANNILVYDEESKVAGIVDILTYDKDGNFRIYDMKTMKGNMFEERYKDATEPKYFTKFGKYSKWDSNSRQISVYAIALNNTNHVNVVSGAIIPIEVHSVPYLTKTKVLKLHPIREVKLSNNIVREDITPETVPAKDKRAEPNTVKKEDKGRTLFDNFSVSEFRKNESDELRLKHQLQLAKLIGVIKKDMNKMPSFKEFLEVIKDKISTNNINKYLMGIIVAWEDNGYEVSNYQKAYDEVFNTIEDLTNDFFDSFYQDPKYNTEKNKNSKDKTDATNKSLKQENSNVEDIDEKSNKAKVIATDLKASFYSVDKKTHELVEATDINPLKCMDYDYMEIGKIFNIQIANDFENVKIVHYYEQTINGKIITRYETKPFKDFNFVEGSNEYLDNLPLVAVDPNTGEQIFFIHQPLWYNEMNVGGEDDIAQQQIIIDSSRKNVRDFRKKAINNIIANKETQIEITKVKGSSKEQDGQNYEPVLIKSPQSEISGVKPAGDDRASIFFNNKLYILNTSNISTEILEEDIIFHHKNIFPGNNVEIRKIGYDWSTGTKKTIYAVYSLSQPVKLVGTGMDTTSENNLQDNVLISGIKNAFKAFLTKTSTDGVIKEIEATVDCDITTIRGLYNYLRIFTFASIYKLASPSSDYDIIETLFELRDGRLGDKSSLKHGTLFINTINNSTIVMGIAGVRESFMIINKSLANDPNILNKLDEFFNKYGKDIKLTTNDKVLENLYNTKIPLLNDGLSSLDKSRTFKEILGNNLTTNIKSYNVGTEENPKYVTRTQPTIIFKSIGETIEEKEKQIAADLENLESTPEEQDTNSLNDDTLLFLNEEDVVMPINNNSFIRDGSINLSVGVMSQEDADKLATDNIIIKGLTLNDIREIVSSLYNMILAEFDENEDESLTENAILEKVKKEFDTSFKNELDEVETKINKIKNALEIDKAKLSFSQTNKLNNLLAFTIESKEKYTIIKDNWDKLLKLAEEELFLRTNIVRTRIEDTNEVVSIDNLEDMNIIDSDDLDNQIDDSDDIDDVSDMEEEDIEGRTKSLGKSVLEESSKVKLPYILRRLFSALKEKDKDGNELKNRFMMNKYYDFDYIYDKIVELLLVDDDIPPNFEVMLAKLEQYQDSIPWLNDLITRLKNTSDKVKTQFTINFAKHFVFMKAPSIRINKKDGSHQLQVLNSDLMGTQKRILAGFDNMHMMTKSFKFKNGEFVIQPNEIKKILLNWLPLAKGIKLPIYAIGTKNDLKLFEKLLGSQMTLEDIKNSLFSPKVKDQLLEILTSTKVSDFTKFNVVTSLKQSIGIFRMDNKLHFIAGGLERTKIDDGIATQVQELLDSVGLTLSLETIKHLGNKGIKIYINSRMSNVNLSELLMSDEGAYKNVIGKIFENLKNYMLNPSLETNLIPTISESLSNYGMKIASIESMYGDYNTGAVINVNHKNIYLVTLPSFASDTVTKLKKDKEYRKTLLTNSLTSENLILQLLEDDEKYLDSFRLNELSLQALTKIGVKNIGDFRVDKLSATDLELLNLILFQDTKTQSIDKNFKYNPEPRLMKILFPTLSDKARGLMLDIPGFNFQATHFKWEGDEITSLTDDTLKLVFDQLALPEIKRIYNRLHNEPSIKFKGYDTLSHIFTQVNAFNKIKVNGVNIMEYMKTHSLEDSLAIYSNEFKKVLNNLFISKVNKKIEVWKNSSFVDDSFKTPFFDVDYKKSKSNDIKKSAKALVQLMAFDYVINSVLGKAQIVSLFWKDLAYYGKDIKGEHINVISSTDKDFDRIQKEILQAATKRASIMVAPGSKSENANNTSHVRLMLKDGINTSDSFPYIVELYYGKELATKTKKLLDRLKEAQSILTDIRNGKIPDITEDEEKEVETIITDITKELKDPNIYGNLVKFIDVEFTDSQEFQTVKSCLYDLLSNGKIDKALYNTLLTKVNKQLKAEKEGKIFTEDMILTPSELGTILQAEKPVYTGSTVHSDMDTEAMHFFKMSTITLIPQVTIGKQINKLRLGMEKLENSKKMPVRASYNSANKVGSIGDPINIYNPDGTIRHLNINELDKSSLILPNEGLRVQQEANYKAKKKTQNLVSLGTQMMKLLLGNGMENEIFIYKGKPINGKALKKIYNNALITIVRANKNKLYSELGINPLGEKNPYIFIKTLKELILNEARSRGMQDKDVKLLAAEIIKLKDEEEIIKFLIPLWLLNDSNKFESLLISLVRNNISKMKFPGYSYVASTSAGWKLDSEASLSEKEMDNMIYTDFYDFEKGLQDTYTENGELHQIQVFLPSRFKDLDGNLIDIFNAKDENGNPIYWEYNKDHKKVLKKDMIDKELLQAILFRIPTSSHGLMASVAIAGFLPEEQGDSIILTSTMLVKKGLDFDFDKEFAYHFWSSLDESTGQLKKLKSTTSIHVLEKNLRRDEKRLTLLINTLGKNKTEVWTLLSEMRERINTASEDVKSAEYRHAKAEFFQTLDFKNLTYEQKIEKLKELKRIINDTRELLIKLTTNNILDIHHSVLASPSSNVQRKVIKVLSVDYAKSQAEQIYALQSKGNEYEFGFLDDEYQKDVLQQAASGQFSIGVYSNFMTFTSIVQQLDSSNPLRDLSGKSSPTFIDSNNNKLQFKNKYGEYNTLDGDRSIAEVFDEKTQTAVDDLNVNILGKVNITSQTINVDCVLALKGYDKAVYKDSDGQETSVSLPYYFLSQPIIREYVRLMQASILTPFTKDKKNKVLKDLQEKFNFTDDEYKKADNIFYVEELVKNITEPNKLFQVKILKSFLELQKSADYANKLITLLNIAKRISKSFINITELEEKMDIFVNDSANDFGNASVFFEDIKDTTLLTKTQILNYRDEGYIELGNNLYLPKDINGFIATASLGAVKDLYSEHYLQYDPNIKRYLNDFLEHSNATSDFTRTRYKIIFFKALKNFLYADPESKLNYDKNSTDHKTIDRERYRLLCDSDNNMSLASYLQQLKLNRNPIFNNLLLKRFSYDISNVSQRRYSIIKFDGAFQGALYEDRFYTAIDELISDNIPLPSFGYFSSNVPEIDGTQLKKVFDNNLYKFTTDDNRFNLDINTKAKFQYDNKDYKVIMTGYKNGKYHYVIEPFYTTRDLGLDLINVSLLSNPNGGAISYSKYISIQTLNSMGIANRLTKYDTRTNPNIFDNVFKEIPLDINTCISGLELQIFQNNPSLAYNVSNTKELYKLLKSYLSNENEELKPFVSIYNKHSAQKYDLYVYKDGEYHQVPTVGQFGVQIYSQEKNQVFDAFDEVDDITNYSETNGTVEDDKQNIQIQSKEYKIDDLITSIKNNDIDNTLLSLIGIEEIDYFKELASFMHDNTSGESINISFANLGTNNGKFNGNTVFINESLKSDPDLLKLTVFHEYAHALTANELNKYYTIVNNKVVLDITENTPQYVKELDEIYNLAVAAGKKYPEYYSMVAKMDKIREATKTGAVLSYEESLLTPKEAILYGLYNVSEFVANITSNKGFIIYLSKIEYKGVNAGIIEAFKGIIMKVINALIGLNDNTLAKEGLVRVLNFMMNEHNLTPTNQIKTMPTVNIQSEELDDDTEATFTGQSFDFLPDINLNTNEKYNTDKTLLKSNNLNLSKALGFSEEEFNQGNDLVEKCK